MPLRSKLKRTLSRTLRPLARARRSRGFGVHSPFAFRFIRFVLTDPGVYYADACIRQLAASNRERKELMCLYRVIADLHPSSIIVTGKLDESERQTIALADSRLTYIETTDDCNRMGKPMAYISDLTTINLQEIQPLISRVFAASGILFIRDINSTDISLLKQLLTNGMTFTNGHTVIMVSRPDLPRQDFELNF